MCVEHLGSFIIYCLDLRLDLTFRPATRDLTRTRAFSNSRLDSTREYATCKQVCTRLMRTNTHRRSPVISCSSPTARAGTLHDLHSVTSDL